MTDSEKVEKGRGTTRLGQEGMKHPHLAGSENGTLFQIKHIVSGDVSSELPYRLFFKRKNGYKFKKSFQTLEEVHWFVEPYLRLCCEHCKDKGIVQKVCNVGGIYDGISNFPRDHISKPTQSRFHPDGKKGECLVCHGIYEVYYQGHVKRLRPAVENLCTEKRD